MCSPYSNRCGSTGYHLSTREEGDSVDAHCGEEQSRGSGWRCQQTVLFDLCEQLPDVQNANVSDYVHCLLVCCKDEGKLQQYLSSRYSTMCTRELVSYLYEFDKVWRVNTIEFFFSFDVCPISRMYLLASPLSERAPPPFQLESLWTASRPFFSLHFHSFAHICIQLLFWKG